MEREPSQTYDVTAFAMRMAEAAAIAETTGDLEMLDRCGDDMITLLERYPDQSYALLEVLAASELPMVRGNAAFGLDAAIKVNEEGTIKIWKRLLSDPATKVVEAAVANYNFAAYPEEGERATLKRKHKRALKPYIRLALTRLSER